MIAKNNHDGFTIVELAVVVIIISVLATLGVFGFVSIRQQARNTQRSSRLSVVSEALEKYYNQNGEYPSCSAMTASSSTVTTNTLIGLDPDTLTAPSDSKGTNSFACTDPTTDKYGYISGGSEYMLEYIEEGTGDVVAINSRHHN